MPICEDLQEQPRIVLKLHGAYLLVAKDNDSLLAFTALVSRKK